MVIYGVALLSFCMLVGVFVGDVLGDLIGVQANVGGVGIAMLLLIVLTNLSNKQFHIASATEGGIHFWSAMYIPIVVAMAAKKNVERNIRAMPLNGLLILAFGGSSAAEVDTVDTSSLLNGGFFFLAR